MDRYGNEGLGEGAAGEQGNVGDVDEGVQKAVQEFKRDPAAVSKKTEQKAGSEAGGTGGGIPHGEPEDRQRFRSWNPVCQEDIDGGALYGGGLRSYA